MSEQNAAVTEEFAPAYALGKKQVINTEYKGVPVFVIPQDMKVANLSELVNEQLPRPYSLQQLVKIITEESFIAYYNRFATDSSTIFVNDANSSFTAVLDYHEAPNTPSWKRHTAHYECPKTKEWGNWMKFNNEKMSQEEFALFIEDNIKEIIEPNGADMLQIASTLKASNSVDFKSGIRLDNGQVQFNYTETIAGQAGVAGQLEIPEKIKLIMAPFLKGSAYEIEARFRYRIAQGGLTMWYTLIRPHVFVDDAFADVVEKIKAGMEKGYLVHGTI
jgi:uncharacterized protein YfdQ (DUF2303 family)